MEYIYSPLSDPANQIRLLSLLPGTWDDELRIRFQTNDLEKSTNDNTSKRRTIASPYEALSYAWGAQDNRFPVSILDNDLRTTTITRNLDVALRNLRHHHEHRILWVDALCIDQQSNSEKSAQAAAMGQIFAEADEVIIWLGLSQDDSDEALESFELINRSVIYQWNTYRFERTPGCHQDHYHLADARLAMTYHSESLSALLSLMRRPYFNRAWIRQEIFSATKASVYCGKKIMPWTNFRNTQALLTLKSFKSSDDNTELEEELSVRCHRLFIMIFHTINGHDYTSMRSDLGRTLCHDPRDKIYAALAIINSPTGSLGIKPDYSRPVEAVYTDVALRQIKSSMSLEILYTCSLPSRVLDIPSWVPAWSAPFPIQFAIQSRWSACAWVSAHITSATEKSRNVSGIRIAEIFTVYEANISLSDPEEMQAQALETLRRFAVDSKHPGTSVDNETEWSGIVFLALFWEYLSDSLYPFRSWGITLSRCSELIRKLWSSGKNDNHSLDEETRLLLLDFSIYHENIPVFETSNGLVGLSYSGVQAGDEIWVLLGYRYPVLLRPYPKDHEHPGRAFEFVTRCCVPGIMCGEAIYKSRITRQYLPVDSFMRNLRIDEWDVAFLDRNTDTLIHDPSVVLEEAGIKVERRISEESSHLGSSS